VTRQVIKLGSSSIASGDGLALDVIAGLVAQIATAQRAGHEIILVTSGAARLGRRLGEMLTAGSVRVGELAAVTALFALVTLSLAGGAYNPFIYFRF